MSQPTITIRCLPQGICSWNYTLETAGRHATTELLGLGEQGAVTVDGVRLDVRKQGMFSGRWTMEHEGNEVASAHKSSAFKRSFVLEDPSGRLDLRAESALGRTFLLEQDGRLVAAIRPDHPFTRRTTIEVKSESWDLPTVVFSFWLVLLMWRREAQSSSA